MVTEKKYLELNYKYKNKLYNDLMGIQNLSIIA